MKLTFSNLVGACWFGCVFAAPQNVGTGLRLALSNPLEGFPTLTGFGSRPGFAFVDLDGVYRAYLADGSVIDAARLTPEQIQIWVDGRAPLLSAAAAEEERVAYASANAQDVPEDQLLNPPDNIKPHAQIAAMAKSPANLSPLMLSKRQLSCPSFYSVDRPLICGMYGCRCNGIVCVIY